MGLKDIMDYLNGVIYRSASDETKDKIEKINAGSLESVFNTAAEHGIDLFGGEESNGYIKNNNETIAKYLSFVNPNFSAREFIDFAQRLFKSVASVQGWEALDNEVKPFVSKDFNFMDIHIEKPVNFSVSYLHLYMREDDIETLQVCLSVNDRINGDDRNAARYFLRFKRPSQFKVVEMRRVKTTACPNCGAPVLFRKGNMEQCGYCGQYVTFEEYGWLLAEAELITKATQINNVGIF